MKKRKHVFLDFFLVMMSFSFANRTKSGPIICHISGSETYFSFKLWMPEEDARAFDPSKDKTKFKVWADLWCVFLSDIHLTYVLCDVFCDIDVKIGYPLHQIQMRRPFHVFLFFIKDIYNTSVFFPSTSINPLSCRAILFPNHPRLFHFFSY